MEFLQYNKNTLISTVHDAKMAYWEIAKEGLLPFLTIEQKNAIESHEKRS
jgi:hypothetical protein